MKGYIYLIENKINQKKYVGLTARTVEERWKEHCKDCSRRSFEKRPLYDAINKYGKDSFIVSTLEEVDLTVLAERERYWINFYNTYQDGYNATLGGDGTSTVDRIAILEMYSIYQNQREVQRLLGYDTGTIRNVLISQGIEIKSAYDVTLEKLGSKISAYDFENNLIRSFSSQCEAGEWIIGLGKTKITNLKKLSYVIGRAAKGKDNRKQAYGFVWKFD